MCPGMMPIFAWSGVMTPGQFGPMSRLRVAPRKCLARTMSATGMPSVMQMTSGIPAAAASMIASAAAGGGTKMSAQSAPSLATASATVFHTAKPSWVVPPLPGVTPPTTVVPYSRHRAAWNAPSRPVIPWTSTRVERSTRTLTGCGSTRLPPLVGEPLLVRLDDFPVAWVLLRQRLDDDLVARPGVLAFAPSDHVLDEPVAVRALRVLLEERLRFHHRHGSHDVLVRALVRRPPARRAHRGDHQQGQQQDPAASPVRGRPPSSRHRPCLRHSSARDPIRRASACPAPRSSLPSGPRPAGA